MTFGAARIVEVRPLLLAAVRRFATAETVSHTIVSAPVWTLIAARGLPNTDRTVVIYWADAEHSLHTPDGIPVDVGVEVLAPFPDHPPLAFRQTPAGRTANFRHIGGYHALPDVHASLRAWCVEQNVGIAGPNWEIYDRFDEDPAKCETDIYYLLN
jgi:effector-binding domain-containing protein